MNKINIPTKKQFENHLLKYSQYSQSLSWVRWYAEVARHKGLRTVQILSKYKNKNAILLDLGCGIGMSLSILATYFHKTVGCDVSQDAINASRALLKKQNLSIPLKLYGGKKLPFADNSFDIVTAIEVIEHVENPKQFLNEIYRVLKKDGILHVTTANKWWPIEPHYKLLMLSYLPAKIADFYVKISGRGDSYSDIKLPSYDEFRKMVNKKFTIEDITLNLIENYKEYKFDQERGQKVVLVGKLLQFLSKYQKNIFLSNFIVFIKKILIRISLGWLFIAKPR